MKSIPVAVVPVAQGWVIADINVGILYLFAISSLGVYGVIMGGWASNSKYALLGAMRSAAQIVAYEIAMGFALVGVHGKAATNVDQVNQALAEALSDPHVGIILVTDEVAALIQPRMDKLKLRSTVPLVVEIPGPAGPSADQPSLGEVIKRAVGVKI